MKLILKEIEKCILLCANCHLEEHDRLGNEHVVSRSAGEASNGQSSFL
jgi:hypothetical protein